MSTKGHALVVDDDEMIEKVVDKLVERLGCVHSSFNDPDKALIFFRENYESINLAILDYVMPKMSGAKLAAELKNIKPTLPVLLITGILDPDKIAQEERDRVEGILKKPFSMQALQEMIEHLLGPECIVSQDDAPDP